MDKEHGFIVKIEKCADKELEFLSNAALNRKNVRFTFTAQVLALNYEQGTGDEYTDVFVCIRRNNPDVELVMEDNEKEEQQ